MPFEIYTGDCRKIVPTLTTKIDALVSDVPYGINWDADYSRLNGGTNYQGHVWEPIAGDDEPFDPTPWLGYPKVILFGYQYFAKHLPVGTILVWYKKPKQFERKFLGDAELAWMKGGIGVYVYHHAWNGAVRDSEAHTAYHPTQKPVDVMSWCLSRLNLPKGATVLDPYCGSGSTGVAALEMGYNFIGVELKEEFAATARWRCQDAQDWYDRWGASSFEERRSARGAARR